MKHWEIITDNLKKAGWRYGCISRTDHEGRFRRHLLSVEKALFGLRPQFSEAPLEIVLVCD